MDATAADLPRIVGDALLSTGPGGSVWKLDPADRSLDAPVIMLPPGDEIQTHTGPALDIVIVVLSGSGTLETASDPIALAPGGIVWLPARSQRRFVAGPNGLRYFSVHARKPGLGIRPPAS
jgi:quercetin dioxygenase-like cupin family protein